MRQTLMNLVPGERSAMDHIILVAKWCKETDVKIEDTLRYLRERVKYYEKNGSAQLNHRFDQIEIPNHTSLEVLNHANYAIKDIYDALSTQGIRKHEFTHAIFRIHKYEIKHGDASKIMLNA